MTVLKTMPEIITDLKKALIPTTIENLVKASGYNFYDVAKSLADNMELLNVENINNENAYSLKPAPTNNPIDEDPIITNARLAGKLVEKALLPAYRGDYPRQVAVVISHTNQDTYNAKNVINFPPYSQYDNTDTSPSWVSDYYDIENNIGYMCFRNVTMWSTGNDTPEALLQFDPAKVQYLFDRFTTDSTFFTVSTAEPFIPVVLPAWKSVQVL